MLRRRARGGGGPPCQGPKDRSSTVSEAITVSASIAATVPASITYTPVGGSPGVYAATVAVTAVTTNNPAGFGASIAATPLTGPATIAVTDRAVDLPVTSAGITGTATPYGAPAAAWTTGNGTDLAHAFAPVTNGTISVPMKVRNVTVPGAYSGTLTLTFSTL